MQPRRTASAKQGSVANAAGTPSTPTNMQHATSSGLDWPVSQPTRLREEMLAASAVREVTDASWSRFRWSLLADQVGEHGAELGGRDLAGEAPGEAAPPVDHHRHRLVRHPPGTPGAAAGVVGERVGHVELALVGAARRDRVPEGDAHEGDLALELPGDLPEAGLLGPALQSPGLEEVHH